MADKGLSPRQKMINLMYLVLTALLALNVSAEVLNAFVKFDKSIRKSTENIVIKNDDVYAEFQKAYTENPKKVEKWFNKAQELKRKTNEIDSFVQYYKVKCVVEADGPEGDPENVQKKSDNNVGSTIMILQGGGEDLKEHLEEYRAYVIGLIDPKDTAKYSALIHKIQSSINTDPVESLSEPGTTIPWVEASFEHLPLIAVVAMMSKMQNDIRNIESDMLAYLFSQIDAGSWKFNKITAIVNAPASYVKVGEEFKADVFIAAYDTTVKPQIILSNGKELPVENGKGIFQGSTGAAGTYDIKGNILMKNPATGLIDSFPFESQYQVVAPTYAVAADKMNVFYIGVKNPVSITATGKDISATLSGSGKLVRTGPGKYYVTVTKRGKVKINVVADGRTMGSKEFRCLPVPDPYPTVGGKKGGVIPKATLLAQTFVKAQLDNFVFDGLKFPVTSFTVSATIQGFTEEYSTNGATITAQQKGLIRQLNPGQKVYFENIRAKAPDGSIRDLGSISFKLR